MGGSSTFAKNLQMARKNKGFSQDELVEKLNKIAGTDFKRPTISNYENGVSRPEIDLLPVFAKILDISVDSLLGVTDVQLNVQQGVQPKAKTNFKSINRGEPAVPGSEAYNENLINTLEDLVKAKTEIIDLQKIVIKGLEQKVQELGSPKPALTSK